MNERTWSKGSRYGRASSPQSTSWSSSRGAWQRRPTAAVVVHAETRLPVLLRPWDASKGLCAAISAVGWFAPRTVAVDQHAVWVDRAEAGRGM